MLTLILAVLSSQICVLQNGAKQGCSATVDCRGSATCTFEKGRWVLTATSTASDAGTSVSFPTCSAGQALSFDGGVLYCTTLSTANSCGTGQYSKAVDVRGNLTCAVPTGTPGGLTPQIQFNADGGTFGGMADFIAADGIHPTVLPDTVVAAAPSAGRTTQDIGWTAGMPEWPYEIDSFFQQPNWAGMTPPLSGLGSLGSWKLVCHLPDQYSGSNLATNFGTNTSTIAFGSTTSWGFDAGALLGRLEWAVGANTGSGANIWSTMRETTGTLWRGVPSATSGGFKAWERLATLTESTILADGGNPDSASYMFAGWTTCGSTLTTTSDSSAISDTIYVGCDSANSSLHVCSNDRTGSATCTDLGANYPCRSGSAGATGPYGYDIFFYEVPGGTSVGWFVKSIDRSLSATGTLTDLPLWQTGYLCYYAARNSGHDAGSSSSGSMGIGGECVWQHL